MNNKVFLRREIEARENLIRRKKEDIEKLKEVIQLLKGEIKQLKKHLTK